MLQKLWRLREDLFVSASACWLPAKLLSPLFPSPLPPLQFSFGGAAGASAGSGGGGGVARKALYQKTLTQLRALMIARMAKPEEVRHSSLGLELVGLRWLLPAARLLGSPCWAASGATQASHLTHPLVLPPPSAALLPACPCR